MELYAILGADDEMVVVGEERPGFEQAVVLFGVEEEEVLKCV